MMNAFVLAPLLAFGLGSPGTPNSSTAASVTCPLGTWSGRTWLQIQHGQLEWHVGARTLILKAHYQMAEDGTLSAIVREATCCLDGSEYGHLKKGDTFSFRFQVEDGKMTVTEMKGHFLGDIKQKQILEGVYKKQQRE
jgi:hypothetical protein